MKHLGLGLLFIFSTSSVLANALERRAAKAYSALQESALITCDNSNNPYLKMINTQFTLGVQSVSSFKIKDFKFDLTATASARVYLTSDQLRLDASIVEKGGKWIDFNLSGLSHFENSIVNKYGLHNLKCQVELGVAPAYKISRKKVHINVHPHTNFDSVGRTNTRVNKLLADKGMQQVVLLHDLAPWQKASFISVSDFVSGVNNKVGRLPYKTPLSSVDITEDADIIVSGSGHNKYNFSQDLEVYYTGGNHNYCIWNNTRNLLDAFFVGESSHIEINYVTDGIVVQKKGILKGAMNIPRGVFKRSNRLSDVFTGMSSKQLKNYHKKYFDYFGNDYLNVKKKHFARVRLIYNGAEKLVKEIVGQGRGVFTIEMNYL